jgi:7-cyano-7-deazaguanine synthase
MLTDSCENAVSQTTAEMDKALVLFSGGQDSTVCLAWALQRYRLVETIGFDYGQRHHVEMQCRLDILTRLRTNFTWAAGLGEDHVIDLPVLGQISATSLTRDIAIEIPDNGLPNTFVPGRNLLFLTLAAALAYRRGITTLIGGMCETDYSGYPDCRNDTIQALAGAVSLGMDRKFAFLTPLMYLDKAATWRLGEELGGSEFTELVREHSHSCYMGVRDRRFDWGYGCGTCPACQLRAKGHAAWLGP